MAKLRISQPELHEWKSLMQRLMLHGYGKCNAYQRIAEQKRVSYSSVYRRLEPGYIPSGFQLIGSCMEKERLLDETYRRRPRDKERDRQYSRSYYRGPGVKQYRKKYIRRYRILRPHLKTLLAEILRHNKSLSLEKIVTQVARVEGIRPRLSTIKRYLREQAAVP